MSRRRFERLYAMHYDPVLRYCLRRASREDAMDAAAETFSVAWRRRDTIPTDRPLPWLYGVARRVLSNQRRALGRRRAANARMRVVASNPADEPEAQIVRDQESRDVLEAIGRLRPAEQEIIRLAGWEELTREDIALSLGLSPNAVTKRLNRALDRLATQLGVEDRAGGRFFGRSEASG